MSILITGANGKLGSLIIGQLLKIVPPEHLIAGVRRLESGKQYEQQGITVRLCDYDQPESLEAAFAGASQILLISSSHHDDTIRLRQHIHAVEAAKKSKAGHLLYTSFAYPEHGAGSPVHLHLATEYAIRTTGIPYTFLRNALYTDFLGALDLGAALDKGQLEIPPGDWTFNAVTRRDLALATAAILSQPEVHKNKTYELTAPSPWTFRDVAAALTELTGKPVDLLPDPEISHWIYSFLRSIDTSSTSNQLEQLIGMPLTSLKDSIRPFIA
ncbi:NAD(P)H-binding protein [Paenibacillus brevis]|uniref:NAD(P)H-binding protein n=1 Tax=Paenibacillus brevis TaxID=2841508 RepID=A0ABS6FMZ3_9BACL|nr:NAD(P)H-binding protein [Paenibacillus brevis]MBU5671543.1 NAD(P)H-binding protein [Paenibacillus brevis]